MAKKQNKYAESSPYNALRKMGKDVKSGKKKMDALCNVKKMK